MLVLALLQAVGRSWLLSFLETVTNPPMEIPMSIQVRICGTRNVHLWTMGMVLFLININEFNKFSPPIWSNVRPCNLHFLQHLEQYENEQEYAEGLAHEHRGPQAIRVLFVDGAQHAARADEPYYGEGSNAEPADATCSSKVVGVQSRD